MLTPQEITDAVFEKALFNGYDLSSVDDFIEKVAVDYGALYKENAVLKGKIKVLVEKVEEYRSTEDAMRMALLTAQKMGEDIMSDANKKRTEALTRTDSEIKSRLMEVRNKIADEEARLQAAAKETSKFVRLSHEIMKRHGEFLSKLEMIRHTATVQPTSPPTKEERISDTAHQIDNAVEKIISKEPEKPEPVRAPVAEPQKTQEPEKPEFDDEGEPTRLFTPTSDGESGDITPRPRFDFDNLKFGANFKNED